MRVPYTVYLSKKAMIFPRLEDRAVFPVVAKADFTEEICDTVMRQPTVKATLAQIPLVGAYPMLVEMLGAWFFQNGDGKWQMVAPETREYDWCAIHHVREERQKNYALVPGSGQVLRVDLPRDHRCVWSGLLPKGVRQAYDWPEILAIRFEEFPPDGYHERPFRMGDVVYIATSSEHLFYYLDADDWHGVFANTI